MPVIEQCVICGRQWPVGAQQECPDYRNGLHRARRTNNRGQDVMLVGAVDPAADSMLLEPSDPVPTEPEPREWSHDEWKTDAESPVQSADDAA